MLSQNETKKLPSLSIFFPVFNEGQNIPIILTEVLSLAPKIAQKYEVLIINDGSTDNTNEIIKKYIKSNKNVKLIEHEKNRGYGAALKTGFYNSHFQYITYMDSDGQFEFSEIFKLLSKIGENDLVIGRRVRRADNFLRILNGMLWNLLVHSLFSIKFKDIDCGFKIMNRKVLDKIPKLKSNGATISVELVMKAKNKGFKIAQVDLIHKPRKFGKATGGSPLHIFRAFLDLYRLSQNA